MFHLDGRIKYKMQNYKSLEEIIDENISQS